MKHPFFKIDWSSTATHHSPLEDAQGIFVAIVVVALALAFLQAAGIATSGVAGLALILNLAFGGAVGLWYFLVNIPFFAFAVLSLGWGFTLKTVMAIGLLSVALSVQERYLTLGEINPVYAALIAGVLLGFGLLAMFRHRASLGGVGIMAIYLQDRLGWPAGLVQLALDLVILMTGALVLPWTAVLLSVLSAVVLNLFLAINHRPNRYVAR